MKTKSELRLLVLQIRFEINC